MSFNWFRRQHDDSPQTPNSETKPENSAAASETASNNSPGSDASSGDSSGDNSGASDAANDMLAFAKAAYKNIQQKQSQSPTVPTETVPTEAETVEPTTDVSEPESVVGETVVTEELTNQELVTQELTVEEIATEEVAAIAEPIPTETEVEIQVETEAIATPSEPNPAPALSFLERAAAERQAKEERLLATAQVEEITVKEVTNSTTGSTESETITEPELTSDLTFDEGFVWSAEVLAAQGRKAEDISIDEITWLKKLRQGLDKTRRNVVNQLKAIVGQGPLNQDAVTEIEALLLQADVGIEATDFIIESLQDRLRSEALPPDAAIAYLKQILRDMLDAPQQKLARPVFAPDKDCLNIWLMTGVNGAGKTTTIGKLAHLAQKSGYNCLIGAADTFRAAAVEQVKVWGGRSGVEVIANPGKNTDPAAVVFDAISAAQSRQTQLLLVDTAGRLQNKKNLMEELSKIRRIIDKKAPNAKVESLLVLDATLGQNGLRQAEVFSQAAQLSGVVLTKLDGTAKGGVALAIVKQLGLPIRFIGAGEGIEDLRPFSSYEFVEALLNG